MSKEKFHGIFNEFDINKRKSNEGIRQHKVLLEQRSFQWLLEHLIPATERVLGCELWVPDTAIFEHGKPKLVVKTDPSNGCLGRYKKNPTLMDLRKIFAVVSRERKKEPPMIEGYAPEGTLSNDQATRQQYIQ